VLPQSTARSSSHGVFQRSPLHQYQRRTSAPSFQTVMDGCPPPARRCHSPRALRPCRSTRLRRFPPCDPLQVYCTLQPVLRFALFQTVFERHRCHALLRGALETPGPPQGRVSHPSEPSPRRPPYRVTAALALLPFMTCVRLQGFSRATNPLSWTGVATSHNPMLSWASFPFRVLPSRSARFMFRFKRDRTGPARAREGPSLVHSAVVWT